MKLNSNPEASRPRSNSGGFSLVEVAFAVALLTVLAASASSVLIPARRQNDLSRDLERGISEVQNTLERIHSTPFALLLTAYPPESEIEVEGLTDGVITVEYEDPDSDLLEILLTLEWSAADGKTWSETFLTARAK